MSAEDFFAQLFNNNKPLNNTNQTNLNRINRTTINNSNTGRNRNKTKKRNKNNNKFEYCERITSKKYKYDFECTQEHLRNLVNYKTDWNREDQLEGRLYAGPNLLPINREINIHHPAINDSFTKSIFVETETETGIKLVDFSIGDSIYIWKLVNEKKKFLHLVCVIWHEGIPYSFGFYSASDYFPEQKNKLMILSPNIMLEIFLIRQKRYNPEVSNEKGKKIFCGLVSMGKLTLKMKNNLNLFLKNLFDTGTIMKETTNIIVKGFNKIERPIETQDLQKAATYKLIKDKFGDYEPFVLSILKHRGLFDDKKYHRYRNISRNTNTFNCAGALDTIFKDLFSCRWRGAFIIPRKCISKTPCEKTKRTTL